MNDEEIKVLQAEVDRLRAIETMFEKPLELLARYREGCESLGDEVTRRGKEIGRLQVVVDIQAKRIAELEDLDEERQHDDSDCDEPREDT